MKKPFTLPVFGRVRVLFCTENQNSTVMDKKKAEFKSQMQLC